MVIFVRMDKIKNTGYELNNWDKEKFFENEKNFPLTGDYCKRF